MADIEYVYYDMRTDSAYRADGSEIANDNILDFPYKSQRRIYFQLLNSYAGDNDFTDVYESLVGVTVTATAAIDNDAIHYDDGALTAVASGSKTSLTIDGLTDTPRIMGTIKLTNTTAQTEAVNYSSWTKVGTVYTFVLADANFSPGAQTLTYAYANDDAVRVRQLPITKDASVDVTGKDTGLFVIDLDCFKAIFQELIEGNEEITGCKLELQVLDSTTYPVIAKRIKVKCSYLLDDDSGAVGGAPSSEYMTWAMAEATFETIQGFVSGTISLKAAAQNVIGIVPAGKLFRPTMAEVLCTAITGGATMPTLKWLAVAADITTARVAANLDAVNKVEMDSLGGVVYYAAGTIFYLEITSGGTSSVHTGKGILTGRMIDA